LTVQDALDTISSMVTVSDDCYSVEYTRHEMTGQCENSAVHFTVSDVCENSNSITVPFNLDLEDPVITCDVEFTDLGWQASTGNFQCGVGGEEPCVQSFVNVGLSYSFSDDCGVKSVSMTVHTDEFPNVDQDAFFLQTSDGSDMYGGDGGQAERAKYTLIINQRSVFMYGGDCQDCVGNQTYDGRIYEVKLTVEDLTGKKNEVTCPIIRVRDSHQNLMYTAVDSGFRFHVAQLSYVVLPDVPGHPTQEPTLQPGAQPTFSPSRDPTLRPSRPPTMQPTLAPSKAPTFVPSNFPSRNPSYVPSRRPTVDPSISPSRPPSLSPSSPPTRSPTSSPPTRSPTLVPSRAPSRDPSIAPSRAPSRLPSRAPSRAPTQPPSRAPSRAPTQSPSRLPSREPTRSSAA